MMGLFTPFLGEGWGLLLAPVVAFLYLLLLTGAGLSLIAGWKGEQGISRFLAGFLLGSSLVAFLFFGLAVTGLISSVAVSLVLMVACILAVRAREDLVSVICASVHEVRVACFSAPRWNAGFALAFLLILFFYLLLAGTPARSADAMRYFLAQLLDLVERQQLAVHPYYHWSFPFYYQLISLPLFYLAGGVGVHFTSLIFFLLSLAALVVLAVRGGIIRIRWILLTLMLIPIAYQEATTATNDWSVCCYLLLMLVFLGRDFTAFSSPPLTLGLLSVSMAVGVKYQALIFLPWALALAWRATKGVGHSFHWRLRSLLFPLLLALVVASPMYLRNMFVWGNPLWPLLIDLFGGPRTYLSRIANEYSAGLAGVRNLTTYLYAIRGIFLEPIIPGLVWMLLIPGLLLRRGAPFFLPFGLGSALLLWAFLQPALYPRFLVFFLPFGLLGLGWALDQWARPRAPFTHWILRCSVLVLLLYGAGLGLYYSRGLLSFYWHQDTERYHWATNYYIPLDYTNRHLGRDSQILTILRSGQTYYLRHDYLRADPTLSGLIDWDQPWTAESMEAEMTRLGITHILIDDAYWRRTEYSHVSTSVASLAETGRARVMRSWPSLRVVFSRLTGDSMETEVILYELKRPGEDGGIVERSIKGGGR